MEAIEASATLRLARISPQKTRLVANLIRGKSVEEAKKTLMFTEKKSAETLLKVLNSAIANAEVKNVEDPEILLVSRVWVDQGPVQRRQQPRARGRVNILRKPTSHITLVVSEDVKAKEEAEARQAAIEAKRAKKREAKKKAAAGEKKAEDKKETKTEKAKAVTKKAATKEKAPKKPAAKKKEAKPAKTSTKAKEDKPKKETKPAKAAAKKKPAATKAKSAAKKTKGKEK